MISVDTCIRSYRSAIMGFATIMVLLFHQYTVNSSLILSVFSHIGHWGVDIFLFVSGFGIAHSLSKNSTIVFYQNRIKKIFPICLIVGVFGFILSMMHGTIDWINLVPRLLCLNNWYVYTITIYYIFSPVILKIMQKKSWVLPFLVFVLAYIFDYCSLFKPLSTSSHFLIYRLPWVWDRFFVYLLGIYFYLQKPRYTTIIFWGGGVLFVIMLMAQYGYIRIPYCFFQILAFCIPFVCLSIGALTKLLSSIEKILCFFGKHSLSIFLIHLIVYSFGESHSSLLPIDGLRLLVEVVLTIAIAVSLDLFIDKVLNFYSKKSW